MPAAFSRAPLHVPSAAHPFPKQGMQTFIAQHHEQAIAARLP
jgi:hypothetical protein